MPSVDTTTISLRVNNQTAWAFEDLAQSKGMTKNALLVEMVQTELSKSLPDGEPEVTTAEAELPPFEMPDNLSRLYAAALSLIDDLTDAGYPEKEILLMLSNDRERML